MKIYIYLLLFAILVIPMVCLAEEETLGDLIEAGEEVIITATKTETKISEAPSIVYVITEEDIRQKGYRSLMEAMASVPGFTVINDHIISSLSIRGMNGVRMWNATLKIMIDGQTASFRPYTLTFIDEEFVGIRKYERELIKIFKQRKNLRDDVILETLKIDPKDSELVKGITNQLENLRTYGLIERKSNGWRWKE